MEEKIFYKTCVCCGQRKSEDNFRRLKRDEGKETERKTWTSNVCKVCEKKGQLTKAQRIANLKKFAQRFKANEAARERMEFEKQLQREDAELGLT